MKILFVTPRLPYPPDTGAKIRTLNLLKETQAAGSKITLVSFFYNEEERASIPKLQVMGFKVIPVRGKDKITMRTVFRALREGVPLSIAKYFSEEMKQVIRNASYRGFDLIHFDHIHLGQYVSVGEGVPSVIDEHNVEALILRRCAKKDPNFLKRIIFMREYFAMKMVEKKFCRQASAVSVVSKDDARALRRVCQENVRIEIIPNGVDTDFFQKDRFGEADMMHHSLVFVGSMDWLPNEDAAVYFAHEIFPLVCRKYPYARFYIVGKNPSPRVQQLAAYDQRIEVTGGVPDVRPFYLKAQVCIVPLRIGGGTRLKILEALAMEKAVVTTTIGVEGIEAVSGKELLVADSPQEFYHAIGRLFEDRQLRNELGKQGRRFVKQRYDWFIIGKKLHQLYGKVVDNGR